ncbi:hypothetical protein ACWDR1_05390 [Streptosporangium sandarakinum]
MSGHPPPSGESSEPAVVYVVTDAARPAGERPDDPYAALWAVLRPLLALALVVVPVLATTALLAGLLLGWPPGALASAAFLALPILINLTDLFGARLGWPPLAWTAARIAEKRRPALAGPTEETPTDD